jgi:drug/metabolite transporter superfamily protein YnfA
LEAGDRKTPDKFELIGAGIALIGTLVIMYWPRR